MRDRSRDKIPLETVPQRLQAYGSAVLAGVVGTPLIVMTFETLPLILPVTLYSALAFFFGWLVPSRSGFRWGFLVTLGIPLAVLLGILSGVVTVPVEQSNEVPYPLASLWGAMLVLAITPAFIGGIVGGTMGRLFARRRPG